MEQSGELRLGGCGSQREEGNKQWTDWGLAAISSPIKWTWSFLFPDSGRKPEQQYLNMVLIKVHVYTIPVESS